MTRYALSDLLRRPIVVAPMAGGPSTTGLVIAAADAGALGFLAAGYKTPAAMAAEIAAVRAATSGAFGVNVFVPGTPCADPGAQAVIAAGAVAAQCGTAFLRCPESGAHPRYKAALADQRYTATMLTRAFSGRLARGLVNQFVRDHQDAPAAYPEINNATRPLRAAAAAEGDAERMSLWAGQGYRSATEYPAAEIIERLSTTG